jgi:aldehyde dehydrogenase (NAD+)
MTLRWDYRMFIDGQWTTGEAVGQVEVINPATEEVVGTVLEASTKDAVRAIEAARKAFDDGPWAYMAPKERGAYLVRIAENLERRGAELREMIVEETGSVGFITDYIQAGGSIGLFRNNAALIEHEMKWVDADPPRGGTINVTGSALIKEPIGVVSAITPFNFPFYLNTTKVASALAAGCTVVLKPHPWTPLDAHLIAEAAEEAGLPPGVLNVVVGGGDVGDEMTSNPMVDMVTFTGSTATGRRIMASAAPTIKKLQLELGGKSAMIVLDDVTEDYVKTIGFGATLTHCGQGCVIQTRLVLPEQFVDAYKEGVLESLKAVKIGDPKDSETTLGPLIREQQRARVEGYVRSAQDEGAEIVCGGKRPEHLKKGFFFEPTVFVGKNHMRVAQEEIFGPCMTVVPYAGGDDEAVRIANDSIYGLGGGAVAASQSRAFNVARQIRAGSVNCQGIGGVRAPGMGRGNGQGPGWGTDLMYGPGWRGAFGGYKQSGLGREWGVAGIEDFCEVKSLSWS